MVTGCLSSSRHYRLPRCAPSLFAYTNYYTGAHYRANASLPVLPRPSCLSFSKLVPITVTWLCGSSILLYSSAAFCHLCVLLHTSCYSLYFYLAAKHRRARTLHYPAFMRAALFSYLPGSVTCLGSATPSPFSVLPILSHTFLPFLCTIHLGSWKSLPSAMCWFLRRFASPALPTTCACSAPRLTCRFHLLPLRAADIRFFSVWALWVIVPSHAGSTHALNRQKTCSGGLFLLCLLWRNCHLPACS